MGKIQAYFQPRMSKLDKVSNGVDARKIANEVFLLEMQDPQIAKCTPKSVFLAAYRLCKAGLVPNHAGGGPYITAFGNKADVDWGVAGYICLAMRTGRYKRVWASVYRENDQFEIRPHDQPPFFHVEANDDPGSIRGAYAVVEFQDGTMQVKRMREPELLEHKDKYAKSSFAWDKDFWAMCEKTVLKKLLKKLHTEQQDVVQKAIRTDVSDDLDGVFAKDVE